MKKLTALILGIVMLMCIACGSSAVKDGKTTSDTYDIKPFAGEALDYELHITDIRWMCVVHH